MSEETEIIMDNENENDNELEDMYPSANSNGEQTAGGGIGNPGATYTDEPALPNSDREMEEAKADTAGNNITDGNTRNGSVELQVQGPGDENQALNIRRRSSAASPYGLPPDEAALPKINNQNTVIMRARTNPDDEEQQPDLMLMHNSRIFYFERDPSKKDNKDNVSLDGAADSLTNNINDMLMSPKYRALSAFYTSFQLLDHAILIGIIWSLFTGPDNSKLAFNEVLFAYWDLFLVIALEYMYGVLEYGVRVWILNRVSIYFVLALFGLYILVVTINDGWTPTVIVLVSLRFVCFVCEISIDVCIDLEVHHDLKVNKIHSMPVRCLCKSIPICQNINSELKNEHDLFDDIPSGWRYKGSIIAWTPLNTFRIGIERLRTEELTDSHRFIFEIMVVFTIFITMPVTIIVGTILGILSLTRSCCCCCNIKYNDTIFAECTKNLSW